MRTPTIKDVARRAGVNPSTVSRVLNDRLRMPISPQTIARIQEAARELDYVPHAAARALAARQTQTIGFLCFAISDPIYGALALAVQSILEERGYHLIVCSANKQSETEASYTRLLTEGRVDGVLVVGSTGASQAVLQQLERRRNTPIVAAGPPLVPQTSDLFAACVAHDGVHGGAAIGQHLATLGHRRVGFITAGGFSRHHSDLRLEGLQAGLGAAGVRDEVRRVDPVENTAEGGSRGVKELLDRHPDLTAIVAHNDSVALGALQALWRMGRRVPEDISVAGYQDIPLAAYTIPPLTTVRIPIQRLAQLATDLLFRAMAGEEIAQREVVVQPELVIRESTAAPRSSGSP